MPILASDALLLDDDGWGDEPEAPEPEELTGWTPEPTPEQRALIRSCFSELDSPPHPDDRLF